jgi:hypothetical protein
MLPPRRAIHAARKLRIDCVDEKSVRTSRTRPSPISTSR